MSQCPGPRRLPPDTSPRYPRCSTAIVRFSDGTARRDVSALVATCRVSSHRRLALPAGGMVIYTLSYTSTPEEQISLSVSIVCASHQDTQNQVVETSCWFESGQGHQRFQYVRRIRLKARQELGDAIGNVPLVSVQTVVIAGRTEKHRHLHAL